MTVVSRLHIAPPDTRREIGDDVRYYRVSQHIDKGEYREAAELARLMLMNEGYYDIRLICYHLAGAFLDEGIGVLPDACTELAALLQDNLEVIGPAKKKERAIDSALGWFFRTVTDHVSFHATQKDATWTAWMETVDAAMPGELVAAISRLIGAAEALIEEPQALGQMTRLMRFCRETLTRLQRRETASETARSSNPAPATNPEPLAALPDEAANDELAAHENLPELSPQPALRASAHEDEALAMQLLRRKLAAFEALMERGDFVKAAVVGHDIRGILGNFDPVLYLPKLFAGYFRTLSRSVEELLPYWQDIDSPQFQALEQYYRADFDTFLAE